MWDRGSYTRHPFLNRGARGGFIACFFVLSRLAMLVALALISLCVHCRAPAPRTLQTIDRGVSESGVATRAFHVYVGVAGTDFDGCDQYSVGWAGGSLLSTRAATNLFIICCCVAVCCCICCVCRYTYFDDYECEDLLDFICCCSKDCCGDCLECILGGCAACLGGCWGACRACCGRVCRRRPRPAAAAAAAADDPAAAEAGRGRSASLDSVGTTTTTTTAATGSSGSLSGGYSSEVAALRAQLAEKVFINYFVGRRCWIMMVMRMVMRMMVRMW